MSKLLLLSGGMDSVAIAFWKRPEFAVTIDYGQRPAGAEVRAAKAVSETLGIKHSVVQCDLSALGSGDLANRRPLDVAPVSEWWPFRNQLLITVAGMKALELGVASLVIGCLSTDGLHKDGSSSFISAMSAILSSQEGGVTVEAPAISLTAPELVRTSQIPFDLISWAHSCHRANEACGECRGCLKHYETMSALGYDPY